MVTETQSLGETAERLRPFDNISTHGGNADDKEPQKAAADHRYHAAEVLPAREASQIFTLSFLICLEKWSNGHLLQMEAVAVSWC